MPPPFPPLPFFTVTIFHLLTPAHPQSNSVALQTQLRKKNQPIPKPHPISPSNSTQPTSRNPKEKAEPIQSRNM
ncbi:hypothetical protein L211DRAFT_832441 [Terfezia boudieri ATCC MYA-4762]|uniref:Uncharacterized protein n=1 Tax=Terfezia boudieri ATCC MYA-4762 TaxID=1051890 RepID=A0A3N4MBP8_9PEZI|nr:hypothetical protein L211DRAFT_832441 [Terfezia boudieri ATCC MYA-4762]